MIRYSYKVDGVTHLADIREGMPVVSKGKPALAQDLKPGDVFFWNTWDTMGKTVLSSIRDVTVTVQLSTDKTPAQIKDILEGGLPGAKVTVTDSSRKKVK